jgi:hypothetical protein
MKKDKILVVGLIVLLMAGGLVLAGCENDPPNPCSIKKGGCSYSVDRYGNVKDLAVCGNTKCRVNQDSLDLEPKPGSCNCK